MNEHTVLPRRLYRSRRERMLAGVAGGLAQYFDVDPVLIRLGFVLLALTHGVGLLAYVILAIVVPLRPLDEDEPAITSTAASGHGRNLLGYVLVGLGALLLVGNLGLFLIFDWGRLWPLVLIVIGAFLLFTYRRNASGLR